MVFGAGGEGSITMSPDVIDYQTVIVGDKKVVEIVMHNRSQCSLYASLLLKARDDKLSGEPNVLDIVDCFELDF